MSRLATSALKFFVFEIIFQSKFYNFSLSIHEFQVQKYIHTADQHMGTGTLADSCGTDWIKAYTLHSRNIRISMVVQISPRNLIKRAQSICDSVLNSIIST